MARILAAMSGGVDSSVAAGLLLEQGHEVVGAYMKNWINEEEIVGECPWEEDIEDARKVCEQLGIEFRVVNLIREYRERVVKYLLAGYEGGVTPNPDVMCNREMKFGVFLDYAIEEGFDSVATGHYAQVRRNGDGSSDLLRGADPNKDQTYFLALLRQEQARRAVFPIGGMLKPEVREAAERMGLSTAGKKDSQGICFIGQVKMKDFLRAFVEDRPGAVVGVDGKKLGTHRGLHLYTLGQRRGLGVASPVYKEAYVVVGKRFERNELVVGFDKMETPGLYASRCRVGSISVVNREIADGARLLAQPRYRTSAEPCGVRWEGESVELGFDDPQRALTPGQICAFYDGDVLLGGGVFEEIYYDVAVLD
ncbi:MAG: tRNA 2-thiouridine(34) synthase MnmA [Verrucomicrobiales bacterium]|nr:tRNA 2-thiouridine(34) synthase MnmA [Verrucomicrobiales bacterium]